MCYRIKGKSEDNLAQLLFVEHRDLEIQRNVFFLLLEVAVESLENMNDLKLIEYHPYQAKDFEWSVSALSDFQKTLRKANQSVKKISHDCANITQVKPNHFV